MKVTGFYTEDEPIIWSHASKRIFLYHLGFVLKMCNNQAFYFYKRILQHQLLSSHICI